MNLEDFYKKINGDYDDVLSRLLHENRIIRFVRNFADDTTFIELTLAVDGKRCNEIFRSAHTLKGISATLGFTDLCRVCSLLTEYLRDNDSPNMSKVEILYDTIQKDVQEIYDYLPYIR